MEIKRIDENTVRCIVSKEDLKEHDIKMEDFIRNSSNVNDFLHTIIAMAEEEVGFVADKGVLAMQVAILSPDKLAITFSDSDKSPANQIADQIKDILGEIISGSGVPKKKEKIVEKPAKQVDENLHVYEFDDIDTVVMLSKNMQADLRVKTVLYKDEPANKYILVIYKARASRRDFNVVSNVAIEYGEAIKYDPVKLAYLEEHCVKIIAANVFDKLRKM
ncbi:MAG: adaptor protein MecA [Lachnospira sp.]|nr:adaptor protein MecA [Lachnospira sp.]